MINLDIREDNEFLARKNYLFVSAFKICLVFFTACIGMDINIGNLWVMKVPNIPIWEK